ELRACVRRPPPVRGGGWGREPVQRPRLATEHGCPHRLRLLPGRSERAPLPLRRGRADLHPARTARAVVPRAGPDAQPRPLRPVPPGVTPAVHGPAPVLGPLRGRGHAPGAGDQRVPLRLRPCRRRPPDAAAAAFPATGGGLPRPRRPLRARLRQGGRTGRRPAVGPRVGPPPGGGRPAAAGGRPRPPALLPRPPPPPPPRRPAP